jgi:lipopolysaccharide/colanic/teichoic acid biosynthesis glycosyltransferase
MRYRSHLKPAADLIIAILMILLLSPLLVCISLLLFFTNQGQVFFVQQRPGLQGKPFLIIKFKTMREFYDQEHRLLPDEFRLTKIGKMIRNYSLDELPQLFNVVNGDMSFVGPRPLLMQYLELYSQEQMLRHQVKPGITGWAQVNGRNAIDWEEKFKLDVAYVQKQSFLFDLNILQITALQVLHKKGITEKGMATVSEFKGSTFQTN